MRAFPFLIAGALAFSSFAARAQIAPVPATAGQRASASVTAGPYVALGPSWNIVSARGETVGSVLAYRIGGAISFPLTDGAGAGLDLGYDSRGINRRSAVNESVYTITRAGYITFMPRFSYRMFWFALNLGVPVGASTAAHAGDTTRSSTLGSDAFNNVEYMLEPRIGATVPVIDNERGWLGATFDFGFTLNEITVGGNVSREQAALLGNYRMIALHLGLTYQFPLPGTAP